MMVGRLLQLQLTVGQIAVALVGHVGQAVIVIHKLCYVFIKTTTKNLVTAEVFKQ